MSLKARAALEHLAREFARTQQQNPDPDAAAPSVSTAADATAPADSSSKTKRDSDARTALRALTGRCINRGWPRDPNGPMIHVTPPGKMAGNKQLLWGATVLDFYRVQRKVDPENNTTMFSTGSKLAAWAKMIGEVDYAKDEIEWAEHEDDPKELLPDSLEKQILDMDTADSQTTRIRSFFGVPSKPIGNPRITAQLFPKIEYYLPPDMLPQRLIVNDPDHTLRVVEPSTAPKPGGAGTSDAPDDASAIDDDAMSDDEDSATDDEPAPKKPLRTRHVYRLELTQETKDAIAKELRERKAKEEETANSHGIMRLVPSDDIAYGRVKEGPVIEPIFVRYPPPPPTPLSTPEAELWINKSDALGEGNHSKVYRATWEMPRDIVMPSSICEECASEALFKKLRPEAPEAEIDETLPLDHQLRRLMIAVAAKHGRTGKMVVEEVEKEGQILEVQHEDPAKEGFTVVVDEGRTVRETSYHGTTRTVPIDVKWTGPGNYCKHEKKPLPYATTFRSSIAAKLSIQGDPHLEREAKNYQQFPKHFFQHWSGFNLVPPNHDVTPALAVVPQFYGYYVPEEVEEGEYLSPILLLEDCGTPIQVDDLSEDERHECAGLLFRMHTAGWVHGSFYARNILMQNGSLEDPPSHRQLSEERRFRIVDFGRSQHVKNGPEIMGERSRESLQCQQMFTIGNFAHLADIKHDDETNTKCEDGDNGGGK